MRILSGLQPSGRLHIGNYFGMMQAAIHLQEEGDAYYFIADYHSLTSIHDGRLLRSHVRDLAIDFLACGLDPAKCVFFRQSDVPEHCELSWILSTVTPMGLLERCHSYKDKIANGVKPSHGLFAYPVLMAADILIYDADVVPVGKDQKQHVEVTRDIAIKMNETFGNGLLKLPTPRIREDTAVVPGLDGQKMSKSYGNAILLRDDAKTVSQKIRTMPTDPARVRRSDPGDPEKCPVWSLHQVYSEQSTRDWVREGCKSAGIGCLECKQPVIDAVNAELAPMRERAAGYEEDPTLLRSIIQDGCEKASDLADETLRDVREAMGLDYR